MARLNFAPKKILLKYLAKKFGKYATAVVDNQITDTISTR